MITQSLQLFKYDWRLLLFYNVTVRDMDIILPILWDNGCTNKGIREVALAILNPNSGFTHSNGKSSIMGIGWTDSHEEFINTLVHEINHLQDDICSYYNIPFHGELASVISGDIAMYIYQGFIKSINYA